MKTLSAFFTFTLLSLQIHARDLSLHEAQEVYDQLPSHLTSTFATQCGDRAHVWSYLLKKKFNVDSQKVFLYFTPKSFNFTGMLWGFHVATLIKVDGEDFVIEKIPRYEITRGGFVLREELLFDSPIALPTWLKAHTGFDSCVELDMNDPADKAAFKHFKTIRVYKSPETCVLAKTPAVYWWPNSVYNALYKNIRLKDPIDPRTAQLACANIYPLNTPEGVTVGCQNLLK